LRDRLDNLLYSHPLLRGGFDIIQHLGLLYHLRDPMLSLAQSRSVIRDGGTLLIETAFDISESPAMQLNVQNRIYDDHTTWWTPTLACLAGMLRMSSSSLTRLAS
jgi:hypothetical protein